MKTLTITTPTNKPGQMAYFTIEFKGVDFLNVLDAVENLTCPQDVVNNKLWTIK